MTGRAPADVTDGAARTGTHRGAAPESGTAPRVKRQLQPLVEPQPSQR